MAMSRVGRQCRDRMEHLLVFALVLGLWDLSLSLRPPTNKPGPLGGMRRRATHRSRRSRGVTRCGLPQLTWTRVRPRWTSSGKAFVGLILVPGSCHPVKYIRVALYRSRGRFLCKVCCFQADVVLVLHRRECFSPRSHGTDGLGFGPTRLRLVSPLAIIRVRMERHSLRQDFETSAPR